MLFKSQKQQTVRFKRKFDEELIFKFYLILRKLKLFCSGQKLNHNTTMSWFLVRIINLFNYLEADMKHKDHIFGEMFCGIFFSWKQNDITNRQKVLYDI